MGKVTYIVHDQIHDMVGLRASSVDELPAIHFRSSGGEFKLYQQRLAYVTSRYLASFSLLDVRKFQAMITNYKLDPKQTFTQVIYSINRLVYYGISPLFLYNEIIVPHLYFSGIFFSLKMTLNSSVSHSKPSFTHALP